MTSSEEEEKNFLEKHRGFDDSDGEREDNWKKRNNPVLQNEELHDTSKNELHQKRNCLIILVVTLGLIFVVLIIGEMFLYQTHPQRGYTSPRLIGTFNPKWVDVVEDVMSSMNTSANPCVDFYEYSCGSWLKNNTIPSDHAYWNKAFNTLQENNYRLLEKLLTSQQPPKSTIGKFYASCVDTQALDQVGIMPLYTTHPFLVLVDDWKDVAGDPSLLSDAIAKVVATLHRHKIFVFFSVDARPSLSDPTRMLLQLDQVPFSLPSREYYFDEAYEQLRMRFTEHIARVLAKLDVTDNRHELALQVVKLETFLASKSFTKIELLDLTVTNNPTTMFDLRDLAPDWRWDTYLAQIGAPVPSVDAAINLFSPNYVKAVSTIFKPLYSGDLSPTFSLAAIQVYVKYRIAASTYGYLSAELQNEFFLLQQMIYDVVQQEPREKQCLDITNDLLGELVGASFVVEAFPLSAHQRAQKLINLIETSFKDMLQSSSWMDDITKRRALEKLGLVYNKIGFPVVWTNHTYLDRKIKADTLFSNVMEANAFNFDLDIASLKTAVAKEKWTITPQTINAYYNPSFNEIVVPAGILQGPYFSENQPSALNFGAIGGLLGHELTHGFDESGSMFDKDGKIGVWWTPVIKDQYDKLTSCISVQYSGYPGTVDSNVVYVNGNLTLNENIADNAGVRSAFSAFQKFKKDLPHDEKDVDIATNFAGLSNDKLFFIGWAQLWCTLYRPDYLKSQLVSDIHSPGKWRANGPLFYFEEFHKTFGCKPPTKQCSVW